MLVCVCGGSVVALAVGSAYSASVPLASPGRLPLGWYGGCIVLTA